MKKLTIRELEAKKGNGKITALTAYDYTAASILDEAGVDLILVGDTLGMVIQGAASTVSVTMEDMIYHGRIVGRAIKHAFFVVDMPFGSCATFEEGVKNGVRLIRETGADAVKIEGASKVQLDIIAALAVAGVVTIGHIGLQPQQINTMGGYRTQGFDNAEQIKSEAKALEAAGARLVVLEGLEADCAGEITELICIPTIGIGAGAACDGQVLVYHDIFGLYGGKIPKFAKKYVEGRGILNEAAAKYIAEVSAGIFPAQEHTYQKKR